jgi:hypothetical protein
LVFFCAYQKNAQKNSSPIEIFEFPVVFGDEFFSFFSKKRLMGKEYEDTLGDALTN